VQSDKQNLVIFGATGSIGTSTLAVIEKHQDKFSIYALTANKNVDELFALCVKHRPSYAAMVDEQAASLLAEKIKASNLPIKVLSGALALDELAKDINVTTIVSAIVGAAGLSSNIIAAQSGKRILLANKESIVIAGKFLLDAAENGGAEIIPLDSEHNAIFQCHPLANRIGNVGQADESVSKILLTASGGPFLHRELSSFSSVTPEEACAHPRWDMGKKISVDSATMMNKGLEFIEAAVLFGLKAKQIEVVIHPESIIHSMVEYVDGSVLAQLGTADMRIPIAYALGFPDRIESGAQRLDLKKIGQLNFLEPCMNRFPALKLAITAAEEGEALPIILNAANEVCVDAFLHEQLGFTSISELIEKQMTTFSNEKINDLKDVAELDRRVRVATSDSLH